MAIWEIEVGAHWFDMSVKREPEALKGIVALTLFWHDGAVYHELRSDVDELQTAYRAALTGPASAEARMRVWGGVGSRWQARVHVGDTVHLTGAIGEHTLTIAENWPQ